jgi:hypothetical protein
LAQFGSVSVEAEVEFVMKRLMAIGAIVAGFGAAVWGTTQPVHALPGDTVADVTAWMKSNPTIRPSATERLIVSKRDSAAQRFTFEASQFAPGALDASTRESRIRHESFKLFDMQNGVTQARLIESLRAIYGLEVSQDFDRAQTIYTYPTAATVRTGQGQNRLVLSGLQGQLRQGARFAYWVEVGVNPEGKAYAGHIMVFQDRDLDRLEAQIRNR